VKVLETELPGVLVIEPQVISDSRGFFMETFQQRRYTQTGIMGSFVQDNVSCSRRGVLRGLHFQHPQTQGKLAYVLRGEVFDVALDVRLGSPTFGKWFATHLSAENKRQLWLPAGFAHGFCVTSDVAMFCYKCTDYYDRDAEGTVLWNDQALGIDWPVEHPQLSAKDAKACPLSKIDATKLPSYRTSNA
jgi:dTDP-4-dehydrorhamnose 3,5-epimerase